MAVENTLVAARKHLPHAQSSSTICSDSHAKGMLALSAIVPTIIPTRLLQSDLELPLFAAGQIAPLSRRSLFDTRAHSWPVGDSVPDKPEHPELAER